MVSTMDFSLKNFTQITLACLLAPTAVAMLALASAAWSTPDPWKGLIAIGTGAVMFGASLMVVALALLPFHLLVVQRKNSSLWQYVLVSCIATLILFVAFSLFTGSFGPARDWYWLPLAATLQGAVFAKLARPDLR